jgi:DNA repair protein RadC
MECGLLTPRAMTIANKIFEALSNQVLEPLATAELLGDLAERPRERLWRCGVQALGDAELVALVLGTGIRDRPAVEVAADTVRAIGGVGALSRSSPHELAQTPGIGPARAARLSASFELGRRAVDLAQHRRSLASAADVHRTLAPRLVGQPQEVLLIAGIDARNGMIDVAEIARGAIAHVEVHPREVFRPLIRMAAAGGVLVHNHPAGDATPSIEDCAMTWRMREIGRVMGIPIIDHVVIGDRSFRSLAEWLGTDF